MQTRQRHGLAVLAVLALAATACGDAATTIPEATTSSSDAVETSTDGSTVSDESTLVGVQAAQWADNNDLRRRAD